MKERCLYCDDPLPLDHYSDFCSGECEADFHDEDDWEDDDDLHDDLWASEDDVYANDYDDEPGLWDEEESDGTSRK